VFLVVRCRGGSTRVGGCALSEIGSTAPCLSGGPTPISSILTHPPTHTIPTSPKKPALHLDFLWWIPPICLPHRRRERILAHSQTQCTNVPLLPRSAGPHAGWLGPPTPFALMAISLLSPLFSSPLLSTPQPSRCIPTLLTNKLYASEIRNIITTCSITKSAFFCKFF